MDKPLYLAAIDLGSRSCRLVIARKKDDQLEILESQSRTVSLGEGMGHSLQLSKKAMDRAITTLQGFRKKMNQYAPLHYFCAATEACRRATNQTAFVKRAQREVGLELSVITFEQEATFALLGCVTDIKPSTDYVLMFDIGGGSTEIILGDIQNRDDIIIKDCVSIPFGVMNLAEFLSTDLRERYREAVENVHLHVKAFSDKNHLDSLIATGRVQLIGTSGTTTTVAAHKLDLRFYNREKVDGVQLTFDEVQNAIKDLQLNYRPGHFPQSHDSSNQELFLSGLAILDGIVRSWPDLTLTVTDRGVRDGIILQIAQKPELAHNYVIHPAS